MCLVDSYAIIDDEFVSGNVLNKYNEMKSEIKILRLLWNTLFKYGWYKQRNVWKKWHKNNNR